MKQSTLQHDSQPFYTHNNIKTFYISRLLTHIVHIDAHRSFSYIYFYLVCRTGVPNALEWNVYLRTENFNWSSWTWFMSSMLINIYDDDDDMAWLAFNLWSKGDPISNETAICFFSLKKNLQINIVKWVFFLPNLHWTKKNSVERTEYIWMHQIRSGTLKSRLDFRKKKYIETK